MLSYLIGVITGNYQMKDVILQLCVIVFVWACCLPVHESAHAWMADKLGDPTGRLKGRISLNPMAHLSLPGTLMMLVFGFGYAKPVPVNIRNFKKRKQYFALTAAAGPISNLLLAIIFSVFANVAYFILVKNAASNTALIAAYQFFEGVAYVNVALAVFNLIPFPPLDGSRLITMVLPDEMYYKLLSYERYTMYILFGLIFLFNRIGFSPIGFLTRIVFGFIDKLIGLPFELLLR